MDDKITSDSEPTTPAGVVISTKVPAAIPFLTIPVGVRNGSLSASTLSTRVDINIPPLPPFVNAACHVIVCRHSIISPT
jgi:hypothetical protein